MASRFVSSILARVSNLLSLIRSLPSSSSNQANHVLEDLGELETILRKIRAALHDAEQREIREESVKLWLRELRQLAYDAEDVLDEYQYELLRAQQEGRVAAVPACRETKPGDMDDDEEEEEEVSLSTHASSFLSQVSIPHGMAKKIKAIKDAYTEISRDREALQLREWHGKRRIDGTVKYPQIASHLVKSEVFGRDSDKENVIRRLLSDHKGSKFSVVAVVGKGGLGKTTLAQIVYNDERVSQYFDLKIWICVSENFDVVRLTKEMIEYQSMKSLDITELNPLQDILKEKVNGKKLLLVLDDVWNEQKSLWEAFRAPLIGADGVRVMVTTRNNSVATIMQTEDPYHLSYLPEDDCWQLFQCHAFYGRDPHELPSLSEIGRRIVKRCGGLPLAVKSLGGLLRQETDEKEWTEVLQSELWELDNEKEILPALKLSYSRMPSHLKPCFLYCSMFPKDYNFSKQELVRLWMAQGYIQLTEYGSTMEDAGSEYFDELHSRSFFDQAFTNYFKMHGSIHDLARHASEYEFHAVVHPKQCDDLELEEVRHLYVGTNEELLISSLFSKKLRPLRTLLLGSDYVHVLENTCLKLVLSMTSLRALQISRLGYIEELPESIGNLKHLRYLRVHSSYTVRLPRSLGYLFNLQVLHLECPRVTELPWEIGSLINLEVLDLNCPKVKELPWEIGSLINLRYLRFTWGAIENLPASMSQLYSLHTLDLSNCGSLASLPESISQLYNLQKLDLGGCRSLGELPRAAENLQNLQYLNLSGTGIKMVSPGIWKLNKMESFIPNITDVRRDSMPHGIGELVNLTGLHISGLQYINIEESKELINLEIKHQVKFLHLQWDKWNPLLPPLPVFLRVNFEGDNRILTDEETTATVMESLQPRFINLEELQIRGYDGARYPNWIHDPSFNRLTRVRLYACGNGRIPCLPTFGQLPALQHLTLERVAHVKSIGGEFCRRCVPRMTSEANQVAFPSLRKVEFKDMPDWVEWHGELPGDLPQLQELIVERCPRLRTLPTLPSELKIVHLLECLELSSLSGLHDLRCLSELYLIGCPQLQLQADIPPQAKFHKFRIHDCPKLGFLLRHHNVESLEVMQVKGCTGVQLPANNSLPSTLSALYIQDLIKPTDLLLQLRNLNSLGELYISGCPDLHIPPNFPLPSKLRVLLLTDCRSPFCLLGLHNLNSLILLEIRRCPELQLSAEEYLPSNLMTVKINNCLKLTSTLRFQNFTSSDLQLSPSDSLPVQLDELCIEDCFRLTSLVGLRHLRILRISGCPELQLLQEESLPTNLETLCIVDCPKLTSLVGLQDLTSLQKLHLARCQRLQLRRDISLPSMPDHLEIVGCPRLREWCDRNGYKYAEKLSQVKRLQIFSVGGITSLYEMGKLAYLQCLRMEDRWFQPFETLRLFLSHYIHGEDNELAMLPSTLQNLELVSCRDSYIDLPQSLRLLQRLTIRRSKELYTVVGLHHLASLRYLVIHDCPTLYTLGQLLPPAIMSFTVHHCENLASLPLLHQNLSTLTELHITNCSNLTSVTGLNNVSSIQSLKMIQCPKLHLSPDEILPSSVLQNIEVYDCPGLMDWCQTNRVPIVQVHERIRETNDENMTDHGNMDRDMMNLQMESSSHSPSPIIEYFDSTDERWSD